MKGMSIKINIMEVSKMKKIEKINTIIERTVEEARDSLSWNFGMQMSEFTEWFIRVFLWMSVPICGICGMISRLGEFVCSI